MFWLIMYTFIVVCICESGDHIVYRWKLRKYKMRDLIDENICVMNTNQLNESGDKKLYVINCKDMDAFQTEVMMKQLIERYRNKNVN